MTAPESTWDEVAAHPDVCVTVSTGPRTFRTRRDIRRHIAELMRFIPALPDDEPDACQDVWVNGHTKYYCTLEPGHDSRHKAMAGDFVCATWEDGNGFAFPGPDAPPDDEFAALREFDAAVRGDYPERGES